MHCAPHTSWPAPKPSAPPRTDPTSNRPLPCAPLPLPDARRLALHGPNHPAVALCAARVAVLHQDAGCHEGAAALLQWALAAVARGQGAADTATAAAMQDLVVTVEVQGSSPAAAAAKRVGRDLPEELAGIWGRDTCAAATTAAMREALGGALVCSGDLQGGASNLLQAARGVAELADLAAFAADTAGSSADSTPRPRPPTAPGPQGLAHGLGVQRGALVGMVQRVGVVPAAWLGADVVGVACDAGGASQRAGAAAARAAWRVAEVLEEAGGGGGGEERIR